MIRNNQKRTLIQLLENMLQIEYNSDNPLQYDEGESLQNGAILVGTALETENLHGEWIRGLETYCELVYQGCAAFQQQEQIKLRHKILEDTLYYLGNLVEEKNKIVFMPYKFCMWDSMESVYYAALEEENDWDIRILPIPYIEKRTGKLVDEGEFFANLKGYVSGKEYILENEKPDVIVIHNPYDGSNKITEIVSEYYSSKLVLNTKHLVYIPYYVVQGFEDSLDRILLPGVKNATEIVLQCESVRKQYLHWLPGKTVFALGSPKIDRIVQGLSCGKKKGKCFFFNTHLRSILGNPRCFLRKVKQTLSFFRNHSEYKLIWRPHPLSLPTFINESDKREFLEILAWCDEIVNIEIDKSKDYLEAMLYADAYIGEGSSLVKLFGMQGKPMYIDKFDREDYIEMGKHLRCCSHSVIDGRVWVVGSYSQANAVFSMNMDLQDIKLEYSITVQKYQEIYGVVKEKDNHIYLFPWLGFGVIDIDIISGVQKYCGFREKFDSSTPCELLDVIEYKGIFYLIPGYVQYPLLKFNGSTVEECPGWKEQVQAIVMQNSGILAYQSVFIEDKLYLLSYGSKKILCTDMKTMEISIYHLTLERDNYERLAFHQGKFWMIPEGIGDIISFSLENGIERRYSVPDYFKVSKCHTFTYSYSYGHTIWFTPWMAEEILILDLDSQSFSSLRLPEVLLDNPFNVTDPKLESGFVEGNYLKLLACGGRYHCIIDMEARRVVQVIDNTIPQEILYENSKKIFDSQNIWFCEQGGLEEFVEKVEQSNGIMEREKSLFLENAVNVGNSGRRIWQMIKGLK